jgi:hypothetical protein
MKSFLIVVVILSFLYTCLGSGSPTDTCSSVALAENMRQESAALDVIVSEEESFIISKIDKFNTNANYDSLMLTVPFDSVLRKPREEYFSIHYMTSRLIFRQTRNGKLTLTDLGLLFDLPGQFKPNAKDSAELYSDLKDTTCTKNHLLAHLIGCSKTYLDTLRKTNAAFRKQLQK